MMIAIMLAWMMIPLLHDNDDDVVTMSCCEIVVAEEAVEVEVTVL